jgi:hypothetical protein
MVEVLVATAIVGAMIVASLDAVGMIIRTRRVNADRLTGPGLARDLMAEIMAMPYTDPQTPGISIGLDAGESGVTRAAFDDIDDYHGWSTADPESKAGVARTGYADWTHDVTVTWADRTTGAADTSADTQLKRITVTVTSPTDEVTQLVALRSKYGALEQSLPITGLVVGWAGVELRAGDSPRAQFDAVPLVNLAADAN